MIRCTKSRRRLRRTGGVGAVYRDQPAVRAANLAVAVASDSVYLAEGFPQPRTHQLLANLSPSERNLVTLQGAFTSFRRGQLVFEQGEKHTGIFIIQTGTVRSFYVAPNGREITLAFWQPGNFVGGPEIFGGGTHIWSGEAATDVTLLFLDDSKLRSLVRTVPAFAIGLIEGLAAKGKCYSSILQALGTRSAIARLAQLVLILCEDHSTTLIPSRRGRPMPTHGDLASVVGVTRQWVSVALKRFQQNGLIAIKRGEIELLRPDRIRKLADL